MLSWIELYKPEKFQSSWHVLGLFSNRKNAEILMKIKKDKKMLVAVINNEDRNEIFRCSINFQAVI
jgi:hypothetical protein